MQSICLRNEKASRALTIRIVAMCSGGIDSTAAAFAYKRNGFDVFPLFVNYGQRAAQTESRAFWRVCRFLKMKHPRTVNIEQLGGLTRKSLTFSKSGNPLFPLRNLMLATVGAIYGYDKGCVAIVMGFHRLHSDRYPDTTADFCRCASSVMWSSVRRKLAVVSPFMRIWKAEVVKYAVDHAIPLKLTYSCYSGDKQHCGLCPGCKKRREAFTSAGIDDPTHYADGPS
jgi:7-cyano-7-deazaguanine synthase